MPVIFGSFGLPPPPPSFDFSLERTLWPPFPLFPPEEFFALRRFVAVLAPPETNPDTNDDITLLLRRVRSRRALPSLHECADAPRAIPCRREVAHLSGARRRDAGYGRARDV